MLLSWLWLKFTVISRLCPKSAEQDGLFFIVYPVASIPPSFCGKSPSQASSPSPGRSGFFRLFQKSRFPRTRRRDVSIGVIATQGGFWPLFSENFSKIFWIRPSRQVRVPDIHRWTRHNPSSPLFRFFWQTLSKKPKFFRKKPTSHLRHPVHTQKTRNVPTFFKKLSKPYIRNFFANAQ